MQMNGIMKYAFVQLYFLAFRKMPAYYDNLLHVYSIYFHVNNWALIYTPINLVSYTRWTAVLLRLISESSAVLFLMWKSYNAFFRMFESRLIQLSHSHISWRSLFNLTHMSALFCLVTNIFVSSANSTEKHSLNTVDRLFVYNKKHNGLIIDNWGTPHFFTSSLSLTPS